MIMFWLIAGIFLIFGFVAFFGAPYVPSLRREVRAAFDELYPLTERDVVVDLGSGDGVVLAEAVRRGARCIGYEINPFLVIASRLRLRGHTQIRMENMWKAALPSDVTLVYAFSVTRDSKRLGKYVQQQADVQQRTIHMMTFGTGLKGYEPVRTLKAHALYEIHPRTR